jgi:HEPN domain-containing protein
MKSFKEWLLQSDYDMNTANAMFETGRYFYAVFMCHLSIEKCLKGLYAKLLDKLPPKTHNLIYLLENILIQPPDNIYQFIYSINAESVATRYPEDIEKALNEYNEEKTSEIIENSRQVLEWLKKNY